MSLAHQGFPQTQFLWIRVSLLGSGISKLQKICFRAAGERHDHMASLISCPRRFWSYVHCGSKQRWIEENDDFTKGFLQKTASF